jgi:hypothetical protein
MCRVKIYIYMHVCIYMFVCTYIYMYMKLYIHMCTHVIFISTYIYIYIYIHIHTHMYLDMNDEEMREIAKADDYMNNYSTECAVLKWMDNALLTIQNTLHGNVYMYIGIYTYVLVNTYSYICIYINMNIYVHGHMQGQVVKIMT